MIEIFTDGASTGNPGPGGWGAIIREGRRTRELSGGFRRTTNNRMELYAAIAALESLTGPTEVKIHSDSRYLVEGITLGRAERWRSKGWKQSKTRPTPNADLWARLLAVLQRRTVSWEWLPGHAGHPENERADRLAVQAAGQRDLPADEGYEAAESALSQESRGGQPGLFDSPAAGNAVPEPTVAPSQRPYVTAGGSQRGGKVTRVGQPCRKCGTPVVKQVPARKVKPGQKHYYAWYLVCPNCRTIYLVDDARREVSG